MGITDTFYCQAKASSTLLVAPSRYTHFFYRLAHISFEINGDIDSALYLVHVQVNHCRAI